MDNFQAQNLLAASMAALKGNTEMMEALASSGSSECPFTKHAQQDITRGVEYRHLAPKFKGPSPS